MIGEDGHFEGRSMREWDSGLFDLRRTHSRGCEARMTRSDRWGSHASLDNGKAYEQRVPDVRSSRCISYSHQDSHTLWLPSPARLPKCDLGFQTLVKDRR